jgi:hypothetical protein
MKLLADNVEEVFKDCLFKDSELDKDKKPKVTPVIVTGIVNNYGVHPDRLHGHARDVRTMLAQLPKEFFVTSGGGWSFLNLCMRADGEQWTGLHQTQERLACLAIGLGMASWLPDGREFWKAFPGGVPYVQINLADQNSVHKHDWPDDWDYSVSPAGSKKCRTCGEMQYD